MTRTLGSSTLFPLVLITFVILVLGPSVTSYECSEETYFLPYVHIYKNRNSLPIFSLKSTGFVDLRFYSKVTLCINGPAAVYTHIQKTMRDTVPGMEGDISKDSLKSYPEGRLPDIERNGTEPEDDERKREEVYFYYPETDGSAKIYEHECMPINVVSTVLLKKLSREQGRANPELSMDIPISHGQMVFGVYLVGNKESYKFPQLGWFPRRNYGYVLGQDPIVDDSSFFVIGELAYCFRLPNGRNFRIRNWENIDPIKYPKRTRLWWLAQGRTFLHNVRIDDDPAFKGGWKISEYEWYECEGDLHEDGIFLMEGMTTVAPTTHMNYTDVDPLSIFDPNIWTPHGYRKDTNGMSGGDERAEDRIMSSGYHNPLEVPCSLEPYNPDCVLDMDTTTFRDMQNVKGDTSVLTGGATTAITLGGRNVTHFIKFPGCPTAETDEKRLLEVYLELVPQHPRAEDPDSDPKAYLYQNLNDNSTLGWKFDLLELTADIFSSLCLPFQVEMPYGIARLLAWYLYRAHLSDSRYDSIAEKNLPWPMLFNDLERCKSVAKTENGGKGINFQWEVGEDTGRWKVPPLNEYVKKPRKKRSKTIKRRRIRKAYEFNQTSLKFDDGKQNKKVLSRKKRSRFFKINGSVISTQYVQYGKTLTGVRSEGTWGYAREAIQEYKKKPDLNDPRADAYKYLELPENIHHCTAPKEDPVTKEVYCYKTEELFFYEDAAELEFELNLAIDMWWKIWATVIGYCNKAYHSRKSETFPRLYQAKWEYFFEPIQKEWTQPQDNNALRIILSEFLSQESSVWLNSCLEGAYFNSRSYTYRPPRPLSVDKESAPNYFIEVPHDILYRYIHDPEDNIM